MNRNHFCTVSERVPILLQFTSNNSGVCFGIGKAGVSGLVGKWDVVRICGVCV